MTLSKKKRVNKLHWQQWRKISQESQYDNSVTRIASFAH